MENEELFKVISEFSSQTHGSTDYHKEFLYIKGKTDNEFAPFKAVSKKIDWLEEKEQLLKEGYIIDSIDLFGEEEFVKWYEAQFSRKFQKSLIHKISYLHFPDNRTIFNAIEEVNKAYILLKEKQILLNGKNLPIQLGEWYARCIFGLEQKKSASQRGFDFKLDGNHVEVKVHWSDHSSPKGVKIRKSLVSLSDYVIVIYLARNFMVREICLLDSDFILRKFSGKGHTIFLKDSDASIYFFSRSSKHDNKVVNPTSLLKYSNPTFAMKIAERFQ